ncbi:hypothetical protein BZG84_15830 [Salinivibrio sp. PR932]|uniref:glycosyltransferase family 2 protein n=2 Tax=unclassified Salinivibrio TaxID=2636825 RepID=UPI000988C7F9|nr:glycosyltransferase family A protein [Salinivibrio sp. PR932]OOF13383.1 hypothetical protein BZG84_15830 [Salinivibrio sp. PR932]
MSRSFLVRAKHRLALFFGSSSGMASSSVARSDTFDAALTTVLGSPYFDLSWYKKAQQLPCDLSDKACAEHYIEHATQGADPGPTFSSQFYLAMYPDVAQAGINPLLHYSYHGCHEGRLVNQQQWEETYQLKQVRDALWGGFSQTALAQLTSWAKPSTTSRRLAFYSYYELARWAFFHQQWCAYRTYSASLLPLADDYHERKAAILLHAFAHYRCDGVAAMHDVLAPFSAQWQQDADFMLAWANAHSEDQQRLSMLNHVFERHEFAPIKTFNSDDCLLLRNVTTSPTTPVEGPLVTVIIPVYNAEDSIDIALSSLVAQRWQSLQILVIDDASDDNTVAKVKAWQARDARIELLRQPSNQGAYAARNAGAKAARGDFITTHDADDWSHPEKIAQQMTYLLAHADVMGVCTHWVRVDAQLRVTQNWRPSEKLIHYSHSSFLFRQQVLAEVGMWDPVRCAADTDLIKRVTAFYGQHAVAKILPDVPLAFALDQASSLTRQSISHVRSVYFGLRAVYHQVRGLVRDVQPESLSRADTLIPQTMLRGRENDHTFDVLLVADFSLVTPERPGWVEKLNQALVADQKIALFHWPSMERCTRPFHASLIKALDSDQCRFVVGNEQCAVHSVWISGEVSLENKIDQRPILTQVNEIFIDNKKINNQSLKEVFNIG